MAGELVTQLHPELIHSLLQDGQMHAEMIAQVALSDVKNVTKASSSTLLKVGSAIALSATVLTGALKSYENVPQGHVGFRTRGGRFEHKHANPLKGKHGGDRYGFVGEGPHMHLPIVGGIETISTQDRVSSLGDFHVVGGNTRKQRIEAELTWGVVKATDAEGNPIERELDYEDYVYRAITKSLNNDELSQRVRAVSKEGLRIIMREKDEPAEWTGARLMPEMQAMCGAILLEECGVEMRSLSIGDAAPTEADTIAFGYRMGGDDNPNAEEASMPSVGAIASAIPELRIVPTDPS